MIREIFEHRSSRVIAAGRIVLALLFALWVWIDPVQPVRAGLFGYLLFTAYVAYACALFPIAWSDWWLDFRLTVPTFLVDSAVFVTALFCTEGEGTGFVSAYFAFFAFLVLSVALRWNWRVTLAASVTLALLYVAVGVAIRQGDLWNLPATFLRRSSYMVVVSMIITWFAVQRSLPRVSKFALPPAARATSPYEGALLYALEVTGATGAALAWENAEEPGCTLQRGGTLLGRTRHLSPGELDLFVDMSPALFDRERQRVLKLGPHDTMLVEKGGPGPALAAFLGLPAGLSLPIEGTTGAGQLVLVGIPGLCRDHLALAQSLAREIAHGLDEEEISSLARETAAVRLRGNIARDLHDSVAQSLAGAGYRLAALRQQAIAGKDLLPEIDSISESLHAEQAHIREIIARLRSDAVNPGARNLGTEIDRLTNALSRHWQVEVQYEDAAETLVIPSWLVFEIQQLVREGIANAVRHGTAKTVSVRTERIAGGLSLAIEDDGKGIGGSGDARMPRSIAERVEALAGKMEVSTSRNGGTRISISLPVGGRS